jgi:REP element-mobilizing transposase RayT
MILHHPLKANRCYHIYNRGINGESIFKEARNYDYFLQKYAQYLSPVTDTFAYCLLGNHFHLLVRVKDQTALTSFYSASRSAEALKMSGLHSEDFIVSKQYAKFFSSYTQSINRAYKRTGALIETPFKRIEINNKAYFKMLIWYIHTNPEKHGFVKDFRDYPHSSYHSHLLKKNTKLHREEVISWFGDENSYEDFHSRDHIDKGLGDLIIEI